MKFRTPKIKPKTDKECEKEIDDIISGKNKALNAIIVRKWIKARLQIEPIESIRQNLINEYKAKYGALASGKTSLKQIQEEVITNGKKIETKKSGKEKESRKS